MGPLHTQVEIPEKLQHELHGEAPLFAVREPKMMTQGGMVGGMIVAVGLGALALFLWAMRGSKNGTINVFGIEAPADSPEGIFLTTGGAVLAGIASMALLVATPILAKRPGGVVVGTQTRLLRTWLFGVASEPWSTFKDAKLESDGSIKLVRHLRADGMRPPDDIVQPANAAEIVAIIRERIQAPLVQADKARAAFDDYTFETSHRGPALPLGLRGHLIAGGLIAFGAILTFLIGSSFAQGGTVLVSTNGGPQESVSARDPAAWALPGGVGVALLAAGVLLLALSRPRAKPVTYVATSEALVIRTGPGAQESVPWSEFTGEIERRERRGRAELAFPLRRERRVRTKRGSYREQVVLRIIGVPRVDEVQAAFMTRLAPVTAPAA